MLSLALKGACEHEEEADLRGQRVDGVRRAFKEDLKANSAAIEVQAAVRCAGLLARI